MAGARAVQWPMASDWWPVAGGGKVAMATAAGAQLWLDLLFPSQLPPCLWGGARGDPCPHPLYPGPPALCGQSRDPS